jgi:hypothetical protein
MVGDMDTSYTLSSRQASLVLIGQWFQRQRLWPVIAATVKVHQKMRRYTPTDKLLDAFITILTGGRK